MKVIPVRDSWLEEAADGSFHKSLGHVKEDGRKEGGDPIASLRTCYCYCGNGVGDALGQKYFQKWAPDTGVMGLGGCWGYGTLPFSPASQAHHRHLRSGLSPLKYVCFLSVVHLRPPGKKEAVFLIAIAALGPPRS